jgi:hypothetical protein
MSEHSDQKHAGSSKAMVEDKESSNDERAASEQIESKNVTGGRNTEKRSKLSESETKSKKHRVSRRSIYSDVNRTVTTENESLMGNKKNFKVLEHDKILLSNRIVMLRKEEEKLMK